MIDRLQVAVAVIGVAIGCAGLALLPGQIPGASLAAWADMRSPAFFPIWASIVVLTASLVTGAQALAGILRSEDPEFRLARPARVAAILAAFVVLAPLIGTLTMMIAMMIALSLAFDYPRLGRATVLALVSTAAIYLSFEKGLLILFPHGVLY
jgi:hypothetical protein